MYNVVFTKESDGFFVSVFDQKGNEIYNTEGVNQKEALKKVKEQNFTIANYITSYEDHEIDYRIFMMFYNNYDPALSTFEAGNNAIALILNDGDLIANESFHGYGLNRYLHRQFLKLTR